MALKLAIHRARRFTFGGIASELYLSASEAHTALRRLYSAKLLNSPEATSLAVQRSSLLEFVIHGVRYSFPATLGAVTRGMATSFAGPSLRTLINSSEETTLVWPFENGQSRGTCLYPLYRSVPLAAEKDPQLYDVLTLVDAIRAGAAREREIASSLLTRSLA